jgi:hypothetical protein
VEAEVAKALNIIYLLNGKSVFANVDGQVDVSIAWDLGNPNVSPLMNDLAQIVVGINDTARVDVQRVVTEALDEGVTMQEASERLSGLFEETYRSRVMTVARSEYQGAYNRANVFGYEESGQIAYVELLDNPQHDTELGSDGWTCAQRNGLIVPVGQAQSHIEAEHPNGSLGVAPVLVKALGAE